MFAIVILASMFLYKILEQKNINHLHDKEDYFVEKLNDCVKNTHYNYDNNLDKSCMIYLDKLQNVLFELSKKKSDDYLSIKKISNLKMKYISKEDAMEYILSISANGKNNLDLVSTIGDICYENLLKDCAITEYEKVIKVNEEYAYNHMVDYRLAKIYLSTLDVEKAKKTLETSKKLTKTYESSTKIMVERLEKIKKLEEYVYDDKKLSTLQDLENEMEKKGLGWK